MANTVIQLKYSSTPSSIPPSLANGELAINYADGKLYYKNLTGQIVSFSSAAVANVLSFSTVNANGSLITAAATNSILSISNGDNIEISGDIINDIITIKANLKPAFDVANAAFNYANTVSSGGDVPAGVVANAAYAAANQAGVIANAAFAKANTGGGGSSNSFTTISVPGQSSVVASLNDTLNITPTNGINITTDPVSKTITIGGPTGPNADFGWINVAFSSTNDYGSI